MPGIHIETRLLEREGQAVTNFVERLPAPQSELARHSLKDPYPFDFPDVGQEADEREIESALVQHITRLLLELGAGFAFEAVNKSAARPDLAPALLAVRLCTGPLLGATSDRSRRFLHSLFVGRQVHIEVGGDDFFIDLLFYHIKLRCCVVVELKAGPFKPEHAGQLNFYLSAVDSRLKAEQDNPSIGLCKSQNRVVAEYALRDTHKPMGVAEYQLIETLPQELQASLPSIEQIEAELVASFSPDIED